MLGTRSERHRRPGSLPLAMRLRGGGGDGGVYPLTHAELQWMNPNDRGRGGRTGSSMLEIADGGGRSGNLRGQTRDYITEETLRVDRCSLCAVSQRPLAPPNATCDLGYLYNKEDLMERMLNKTLPPDQAHITSLRCVFDVTLCANPNFKGTAQAHVAAGDEDEVPFQCPVSGVPMNGRHPFRFIKATGQVVSERALQASSAEGRRKPGGEYAWKAGQTCPVTEAPV